MHRSGLACLRWLPKMGTSGLSLRFSARCRSTCIDKEQMLFSTLIDFDPSGKEKMGKILTLKAVYQDSMPTGSPLGTVIATHGSPGSHNDWKYITPRLQQAGVRMIAINYPGLGFSQDRPELKHDNAERTAFVEALMSNIDLNDRIVFMGHSRGSENALMLSARNQSKAVGAVLLNPNCLRRHRGMQPWAVFEFLNNMYDRVPPSRGLLHYLMYKYSNTIGLRTQTGREAVASMKTMASCALHGQIPYLQMINENANIRVLCAYGGLDRLIETEISREFAAHFKQPTHLVCHTSNAQEDGAASAEMRKAFFSDDHRRVTCEFVPDGHFLQKTRVPFVVDAILAMLEAAKRERNQTK